MKKLILIVVSVSLIAAGYGLYLYNKPAKSAESEEVYASVKATDLYAEFLAQPEESTKKYLNKNLEVSGIVDSFSQDSTGSKCVLVTGAPDMGVVSITFLENTPSLKVGETITIRGLFTGYLTDDLLGGNLLLNQAILVQ